MAISNNIELELRAVVCPEDFGRVLTYLEDKATPLSHIQRLSVMFFGKIGVTDFDIRVRTKIDGLAEVVLKKGSLHAEDREEYSQDITRDQFIGFVKMFGSLGFRSKVTQRENFNYRLAGDATISLVRSGDISYVEIEKMSSPERVAEDKAVLEDIARQMNADLISSEDEFNALCSRLDQHDWFFDHSDEHHEKLNSLLVSL